MVATIWFVLPAVPVREFGERVYAVGVVASGLTARFDVGSFKEFGFASVMVCVLRHTWFEW